uniref:Biogenesis of lysosome-related organelles complex 1 subunit 4 n=1 Tax=Caenorhabditis tropicalis TaxID=1561998 RepID=A0A1I7TDK5_9PELO
MRQHLQEEETETDDGTLEVEIDDADDDLFMQIGISDVLKIQQSLIKELDGMTLKSFEENKAVLGTAKAIEESYLKKKHEMGDEIKAVTNRIIRTLKLNHQYVDWNVNMFKKTLREVLMLYVEVNNRMKIEEKGVIKQDAFITQIDKNIKELKDLKENIRAIQAELFEPPPATAILASSTVVTSESASESNQVGTPDKPIETQLATQVFYVNKAMDDLKQELPMCSHLPKLMEPIKEQGVKVAKMVLENPPKSIQEFVETLPPKKRD